MCEKQCLLKQIKRDFLGEEEWCRKSNRAEIKEHKSYGKKKIMNADAIRNGW